MIRIFRRNDEVSGDEASEAERRSEVAVLDRVRARHGSSSVQFGMPTRCPRCGTFGQVAHVDRDRGTTDLLCGRCDEHWMITQRALALRPSTTGPIGTGVLIKQLLAESAPG